MKTVATHNGGFHPDDVFAVATLLIVEPDLRVLRTRDQSLIDSSDYVVDVGFIFDKDKRRFDHHQIGGAGKRENGIQYASFGLVWREFGESIAGGKAEAEIIDRILVQPLDAHDNGMPLAEYFYEDVRPFTIIDFLYSYLLDIDSGEEELYKVFMNNVSIAKELISREVIKAKNTVLDYKKVEDIYQSSEDKRLIVLDKEYSWTNTLMKHEEPVYVIYPRTDGKWSVRAVPLKASVFGTIRKPLPSAWAGKTDGELAEITGVADATFAHRGLFIAVAMTKDGALELAKKALNA